MSHPVLVLINGAPASGKSTMARAWAQRHGADLPLAIDIDVLRSMLGGWLEAPGDAGLAARAVAVAGIRAHLSSGRDVLVPQYLHRTAFIDELRAVAQSVGAGFLECVVTVDADLAAERFDDRRRVAGVGPDPHSPVVHGDLGEFTMDEHVTELERVVNDRPQTVRLSGTLEEMIAQLETAVAHLRG